VRVLVLQHIACEPPGVYEDVLREREAAIQRVEIDEGDTLPEAREFDAIVAMGGPMGAYEEEAHPWLRDEKELIREAVEADVAVWGVCLGAQLLAASLGAEVRPGPRAEVGLLPVELTPAATADPVFGDLPQSFATLQWHSDTFELPEAATLLASSPAYPHQAFVRGRAYGLQFHLEVPPELASEWAEVPAYAQSLEGILGPGAMSTLLEDIRLRADDMLPLARRLFGNWLEHVVRVPAQPIG
jgi:GMP synthase-like glutamine amidotransferase